MKLSAFIWSQSAGDSFSILDDMDGNSLVRNLLSGGRDGKESYMGSCPSAGRHDDPRGQMHVAISCALIESFRIESQMGAALRFFDRHRRSEELVEISHKQKLKSNRSPLLRTSAFFLIHERT
jgi:hypothetical protein